CRDRPSTRNHRRHRPIEHAPCARLAQADSGRTRRPLLRAGHRPAAAVSKREGTTMNDSPDDVLGMTEAYVHGLLSDEQRRFVEIEAERSAVWREALAAARRREALLRGDPAQEPSEALLSRAFTAAALRSDRETTIRRFFTRTLP